MKNPNVKPYSDEETAAGNTGSTPTEGISPKPSLVIRDIPVREIQIPEERRQSADPRTVQALEMSIMRSGLFAPVGVRIRNDIFELVWGCHREIACENLGLETIQAVIVEGDEIDAEMDMIEENLCRREHAVLERARSELRLRNLYWEKYPDTRPGVAGGLARQGQQLRTSAFAVHLSKVLKVSPRCVRERLQIAEALDEEVVRLIGSHDIANSTRQLLVLARMPPEYRFRAAEVVVSGQVRLVDEALAHLGLSAPAEHDAGLKDGAVGDGRAGSAETVAENSEELTSDTEGAEDEEALSVPINAATGKSPVKMPAVDQALASAVVEPIAVFTIVRDVEQQFSLANDSTQTEATNAAIEDKPTKHAKPVARSTSSAEKTSPAMPAARGANAELVCGKKAGTNEFVGATNFLGQTIEVIVQRRPDDVRVSLRVVPTRHAGA